MANGRPPESEDDWKQVIGAEVFSAPIPIIGQAGVNYFYGFERTGRLEVTEGIKEAGDGFRVLADLVSGEKTLDDVGYKLADKMYGAFALTAGAPLTEPRRAAKMIQDWAEGNDVDIRDLVGKEWGRKPD